jgi:UDP-N-acetylglucosamine transferase subunit ALG13
LNNTIRIKKIKKMKPRIFNVAIVIVATCFATSLTSLAQSPVKAIAPTDSAVSPAPPEDVNVEPVIVSTNTSTAINTRIVKVKLHKLNVQLKKLSVQANAQVMAAVKNINIDVDADIDDIAPQINVIVSNAGVNTITTTTTNDDDDRVKNYSKTYPADANDILSIENKYGNVTVNTWNRNEVKVDVQVKVSAGSDDATQKLLDNVNISDSKNGSLISFRTIIGEVKSSWYSVFQGGSSKKMEINYTVYMPAKNELVIDNRYGAIYLPDLDGKVTINSSYGSLKAKSLTNESTLRVKYGNANIDNLNNSTIQLSYGDLTIGSVNTLTADVSYSPVKIGKLHTSAGINLRYGGGLQIGDLDRDVKNLAINSSYSNIDIGLSGDEDADFAIVTRYGDFNYGDHAFTVTAKTPDDGEKGFHSTKSYKGYIGRANSGKTIAINSSYGNVKFN